MAAAWKTVSCPATARSHAAGSSTSPRTTSTSSPRTLSVGSLASASTRTRTPRASRALTMELPRKPHPPVTRAAFIAIVASMLDDSETPGAVHASRLNADRHGPSFLVPPIAAQDQVDPDAARDGGDAERDVRERAVRDRLVARVGVRLAGVVEIALCRQRLHAEIGAGAGRGHAGSECHPAPSAARAALLLLLDRGVLARRLGSSGRIA